LLRQIGFLLALLLVAVSAEATESRTPEYSQELLLKVQELRLWEHRYWHLLLHYKKDLWGGYVSEADGEAFFLAPNGKTDPRAELEATIRKLFTDDPVGRTAQPTQCAFVGRYHWLKTVLAIDDRRLLPNICERFTAWLQALNPQSVTLIFPSAFMNSPSSMFGHTLLRIDQKGQTEQTRILAYTINYAADVTTDNGFVYAYRGMTGGFKGYFSTMPYYLKVQEYRDLESRDIWEYRLNFSEEQVLQMLRHAWELGNTYFDYYYFKENCAYHILSLLEVADPNLHLTDQFVVWTIPADTLRLIANQAGLITDIVFRPSLTTQIEGRNATLSEKERPWLGRIAKNPEVAKSDEFHRLSADRQAFVLDVASHYLRYLSLADDRHAALYKGRNRAVLLARSALKVQSAPVFISPGVAPPEQGHPTRRVGLGFGWRQDEFFEEFNLRPAYHDLLDPHAGFRSDAQIEFMSLKLRHYEKHNQFRLERLTVLDILSLSPIDRLFQPPSWKVHVGWETLRREGCRYCGGANFNVGPGAAMETRWLRREVFFAFAELDVNYSHAFEENHRVGGGGSIGMLMDLTDRWRMLISASYLRYPLGDVSDNTKYSFQQRYTLFKNWAIRLELNHFERHDNEALVTVQSYF
jgi:hypothetical protein